MIIGTSYFPAGCVERCMWPGGGGMVGSGGQELYSYEGPELQKVLTSKTN